MARRKLRIVALYARISTRDGIQEARNQLFQLRDYCRKHGWKVLAEYLMRNPATRQRGSSSGA